MKTRKFQKVENGKTIIYTVNGMNANKKVYDNMDCCMVSNQEVDYSIYYNTPNEVINSFFVDGFNEVK